MVVSGEGKGNVKAENSKVFRFVSLTVCFWQLINRVLNGVSAAENKSGRFGFWGSGLLGLTAEQIPSADQPIEEQKPIQMIYFMLDGSGFIALHLKLPGLAEFILSPECYEFSVSDVPQSA